MKTLGTLDYDYFKSSAEAFVRLSDKIGDGWYLRTHETCSGAETYVTQQTQVQVHTSDGSRETGSIHSADSEDFWTYDYQIIYNCSYSVPVLYFNAYHTDGRLCTLEEIWDGVHCSYKQQVRENKWSALTQQDHPFLGTPYFSIHPCYTSSLMSEILSVSEDKSNYLVSWLSIIGPLIGLKMSPKYAMLS